MGTTRALALTAAAATALLAACEEKKPPANPPPTLPPTSTGTTVPAATGAPASATGAPRSETTTTVAPDNTKRNDNPGGLTAEDQSETAVDRAVTADIRKAILKLDGMSINGQNVKIITRGGTVTLKGPVASAEEKGAIERAALAVAGVKSVVNELEVANR